LPIKNFCKWLGVSKSKFYKWRARYGHANEHNGRVPRDHWLEEWEKQAILDFHEKHPLDGYRRLTFMMLDQDIVAVSPSSTYRVLKTAGRLDRWNAKPSKKGTGFHQPDAPHRHWHIDIAYINVAGTFYFLCSVLDGYSRMILYHEIRESMKEREVEVIMQRALERYPDVKPQVISDNGPQFVARDFKHFIRLAGMTHVRTSPYYPQSNGKIERWHKTMKSSTVRVKSPESLDEARSMVADFVEHYNEERLHSAIGYVTPRAKLEGREKEIWKQRDRKLEEAREKRRQRRAEAREGASGSEVEKRPEPGGKPPCRRIEPPAGAAGPVTERPERSGGAAQPLDRPGLAGYPGGGCEGA
jgi:putative transposase